MADLSPAARAVLEAMRRGDCAECGGTIGQDKGPPDGWQLEDGRTVCHACCVADFREFVDRAIAGHTTRLTH